MLEQAASDQADLEESTRLQGIEAGEEKVRRYKAFVANVESTPDAAFGRTPGSASNRKQNLIQMFLDNPEKAMKALEDIWAKQDEIANRPASPKTHTQIAAEEASKILEGRRPGIQKKIMTLMGMDDVPESEKQKIQTLYGGPDTLTEDDLKSFRTDYATAMATRKPKDYTAERNRTFEYLKQKGRFAKFNKREQELIEYYEQEEDPKIALDNVKKFMTERKYEGQFQVIDSKKYKKNGRYVTVETQWNPATQEKIIVETDGASITHRETLSGKVINERFSGYFKVKFDPNKLYNMDIVNGKPYMTGSIYDMTKSDPDKAKRMATDMRVQAVSMKLITNDDAELMMSMPPGEQVKTINKLLIEGKTAEPNYDGVIRSGEEINRLQKEAKKPEYATAGKNYYWDGKKWEDLEEGRGQEKFGNEQLLRKEYDINTKKYKDSLFAYNSIRQGFLNADKDPGSAGISDIMIVRAFLLMIEPNSVVRESEFASAARAQGLVEYSNSLIKKMQDGAILTKESRGRFMNAATAYMTAVMAAHKMQRERYTKVANDYGLTPARIIDDPFANLEELKDLYLEAPPGSSGSGEKNSGGQRRNPVFVRD